MSIADEANGPPALVTVEPPASRLDERVSVRLAGLPPGRAVTLRAAMTDHFGRRWRSAATFVADAGGAVDVATHAPAGGSYAGADPMGLFWSMAADEPGGPPLPLRTLDPLRVRLTAETGGRAVAEACLERRLLAPGVAWEAVRGGDLAGRFFRPPGPGPHPAVVTLAGWYGGGVGCARAWAALLAAHGYAALALACFACEHPPPHLLPAPLEHGEAALAWLAARPEVRADRLAAVGISRGGELALLLGATFPQVTAVVGYAPGGDLHAGAGSGGAPAWAFRGPPLPRPYPAGPAARRAAAAAAGPVSLTSWFLGSLAQGDEAERATIPIERINGPVLLLSGADDQLWPSPALADLAVLRLVAHGLPGRPHEARHVRYPGAGHCFPLPNLPAGPTARDPVLGRTVTFGGTAAGNARAAGMAWRETLAFLDAWRRP